MAGKKLELEGIQRSYFFKMQHIGTKSNFDWLFDNKSSVQFDTVEDAARCLKDIIPDSQIRKVRVQERGPHNPKWVVIEEIDYES